MVDEPQDITCPTCHGEKFKVVDKSVGLLRCDFCQNQWVDSRFAKPDETEIIIREKTKKSLFKREHTELWVEVPSDATDAERQELEELLNNEWPKDPFDFSLRPEPETNPLIAAIKKLKLPWRSD